MNGEDAPVLKIATDYDFCPNSYINKEGDVEEVCVGTNKKNDLQYYYDRPRITGDYHGQAPMLWCAYALLCE